MVAIGHVAYLGRHDRRGARALLAQIGPYLGATPAYGYFWVKQAEGFETVWKWAR